jgi:hypothetical protein
MIPSSPDEIGRFARSQNDHLSRRSHLSTGLLGRSPTAKLSLEQRTLIEEENFDRERIFDALSRAYGLPSSEIKSLFVEMQPKS